MVSLLLAITTDVDALHDDKSAMSALMAASSNGSTLIVSHLLAAGAKVNCATLTALMRASDCSRLPLIAPERPRLLLMASDGF